MLPPGECVWIIFAQQLKAKILSALGGLRPSDPLTPSPGPLTLNPASGPHCGYSPQAPVIVSLSRACHVVPLAEALDPPVFVSSWTCNFTVKNMLRVKRLCSLYMFCETLKQTVNWQCGSSQKLVHWLEFLLLFTTVKNSSIQSRIW